MSTEMKRLERAQPTVAPPTAEARSEARAALLEAMQASGATLNGTVAPAAAARRRLSPSALVWVGGSAAALIIAVGALVLLHHGTTRSPASPAVSSGTEGRGSIVASGGQVLAGTRVTTRSGTRVETRRYPYGRLAAQILGTVGRITLSEVHSRRYRGVSENAVVGQSGVEWEYDQYLRAGDTVRLSLNLALQRAAQRSLAHAIRHNPPASGGAFVVMNPQNGAIDAIGSAPTFQPSDFTHPMTQRFYRKTFGSNSGDPLIDRAIDSAGPVGSVFTPLTALAAIQSGVWGVDDTYDDTGQYCFRSTTLCLRNSGRAAYGVVNVTSALRVSDDTFFYNLGARLNRDPAVYPNGGPLQRWAALFGVGRPTGVDLAGEASGVLPSPNYLKLLAREETQCENATGPFEGHPKHPASQGGCGISNAQTSKWLVADNVNTAVGQGDVEMTPLQVAVAYAAIANGGTIVRPHLGAAITAPGGAVLETIDAPASRRLELNPAALVAVRRGLREAASAPGGTSADVFGNFREPVYGKTGTAQYIVHGVEQDYAWYAAYVPATATGKPVVVVVTVEQGGFGAVAAAPVARQILSQWFFGKPGPYMAGASTTL